MIALCTLNDLPEDSAKGFSIDGHSLVAVHKAGRVFVYLNQCPHRGVPLEWTPDQFLDTEKNFIQCATHGALFTIESGECIAGPCPGEMLTAVPAKLEDQTIMIDLSSTASHQSSR